MMRRIRVGVGGGKGVRLGYDLLASGVPRKLKKLKLIVLGVLGEKVVVTARSFTQVVK